MIVAQPTLRRSPPSTRSSFSDPKPRSYIGHWGRTVLFCMPTMPVVLAFRLIIRGAHPVRTMSVCKLFVWMRSTARCERFSSSIRHKTSRPSLAHGFAAHAEKQVACAVRTFALPLCVRIAHATPRCKVGAVGHTCTRRFARSAVLPYSFPPAE